MYTLYSRPGSGSAAVEALLAECGVAYRIEDVPAKADGSVSADYSKINLRNEVPTLRLPDDTFMTESAAMMIYLADFHPEAQLAPDVKSVHRPSYLRWMLYFASSVYASDLRYYYPTRYSTEASHADAIKSKAVLAMDRDFSVFAKSFGEGPYILGSKFSAVDIYAAMLMSWANDFPDLCNRYPKLAALYAAVSCRPKVAPVWTRNEMPT